MRNPLFAILSFLLLLVACAALHAQAGTSPSPSAATSPVATATPAVSASPEASVAGVAAPVAGGGPLVGTWKVERAIFELFGAMKDVTAQDERFYETLRLDAGGKGVLRYGAKPDEVTIEYDFKNGQSLTIAYGSRLKPQVDLYNVLVLGDGSLFLRSTRLAQVNGTVFYLFRKGN